MSRAMDKCQCVSELLGWAGFWSFLLLVLCYDIIVAGCFNWVVRVVDAEFELDCSGESGGSVNVG
jgi:hypothetical protein